VDPASVYEESPYHCTKYRNIDTKNLQSCVHRTPTLKHTYHPSMRALESLQDSMVCDPRHQWQPQQIRYQRWCSGAPAEHAESPWESSTSKQPLQTIVVEVGIELIFLVRTPIENCYDHGRHIYRTPKPLKKEAYNDIYGTQSYSYYAVLYPA
jgi:hypothetical protein